MRSMMTWVEPSPRILILPVASTDVITSPAALEEPSEMKLRGLTPQFHFNWCRPGAARA